MHDGHVTINQFSLSIFFCVRLASFSSIWFDSFACNSSCFSPMISQACSRNTLPLCLNNSLRCFYWSRYFVWDIDILLMVEGPRHAFKNGKGRRQQREVVAAAAAVGWQREQQRRWMAVAAAEKVDCSCSKPVNWSRGEGFGSISIYIESQTVPMSISVSPARICWWWKWA